MKLLFEKNIKTYPNIIFVFPGHGPQWWGMGRELLKEEPVFRAKIEGCDSLLQRLGGWSLLEELTADESKSRIDLDCEISQPALVSVQIALAALWESWGILPGMIIGHSVGEIAAAHIAGILSLSEAIKIVHLQGRLMQTKTENGRMAAVGLTQSEAESVLEGYEGRLSIAAINSSASVVLSGETAALEEVAQSLQTKKVFCQFLHSTEVGGHSPLLDPIKSEFTEGLEGLDPQPASIPIFSTVTGEAGDGREFGPTHWWRNLRETVRFSDAIHALPQNVNKVFLELSPHPVLATSIYNCLGDHNREWPVLASLRRGEKDKKVMLETLAAFHTLGCAVDWNTIPQTSGLLIQSSTASSACQGLWLETRETKRLPDLSELRWRLEKATPRERYKVISNHIQIQVAEVLGLEFPRSIEPQRSFFEMGMGSLKSLELRNRLQTSGGCSIPATVAFEYPTIELLAEYLTSKIFFPESSVEIDQWRAEENGKQSERPMFLDDHSRDEIEALLDKELASIEELIGERLALE